MSPVMELGRMNAHCSLRAKRFMIVLGDKCVTCAVLRPARTPTRQPEVAATPELSTLLRMAAMTDGTTTFADVKARVLAFAREREWEQFHAPKNLSMALAAEAAELMEHFLWATPEASRAIADEAAKRARIEEELADVVIYAIEFANMTGIDVAAAIERKMAANAAKYPVEKARGRADKYTEL